MSGFVGWVDFRRDLSTQEDVLHTMTATMRRRGPDAKGIWISRSAVLGHQRLAIVDLEGGKQPMLAETETGTIAIAYVGEIYNFVELRREIEGLGGRFKTRSDTEVLLQSFLLWGHQFVERLDGMFAFAIWDSKVRQLLLGRDRMGVKPLYYFEYPCGLLFATEPKGIFANPLFEARLDISKVPILLQPRLALAGETPLIGLREVPPAHVLSYSPVGLSLRRYWRLISAPHRESFSDTAHQVRAMMEDIVTRQMGADVSCGAMLSGGVDSTSVAGLAMKALQKDTSTGVLDTFCLQFESDSEHFVPTELRPDVDAPYAMIAAQFIGSRHTTITATMRDILNAIPDTRRARDLPGWGQFDASMYLLFSEMRRTCTVALTGEAADEIFGGYPYCFKPELIQRDQFPWLGDGLRLSEFLSPVLLARIDPRDDERARYSQLISEVPRLAGEDPQNARMREVLYLGMSGPLAVILDRKDRMSMAQGLEVRVPFCNHRLIEYVWNVPWSMKSAGGVKGLLKAAMADVLPISTISRKKSAYPHIQNPDYDKAVIHEAARIVSDKRSPIAGLFDTHRLSSLIEEIGATSAKESVDQRSFPGGANAAQMLIQLVEMDRWIHDYKISIH